MTGSSFTAPWTISNTSCGAGDEVSRARRIIDLPPGLTMRQFRWLFSGLVLAMLLAALSQNILVTALPTMAGELNATAHMAWIITAYLLAATISMPVYGKIGDLIGRRGLIQVAIIIFTTGSVVCGLAPNIGTLIAGRAVQGLGAGGLLLLSQTIVGDVVAPRERSRYMGYLGATFGGSSLAGPILGGWFTSDIGWRWAFWFALPLGVAAFIILTKFLPRRTDVTSRPRVDIAGIITLASAMTCLVLATSWAGGVLAFGSWELWLLVVVGILSVSGFVLAERRAYDPILSPHLFTDRNFVLSISAGVIAGAAVFGTWSFLPSYIQMATGVGAMQSGLLIAPLMASFMIFAIVAGRWIGHTGRYKLPPILGMTFMATALLLISQFSVNTAWWQLMAVNALFGIGMGATLQTLVLIAQNSFSLREIGSVTAASWFFRQVGASLGTGLIGGLFGARLSNSLGSSSFAAELSSLTPADLAELPDRTQQTVAEAYNDALLPIFLAIAPLLLLGAILLCFVIPRPLSRFRQETPAQTPGDPDTLRPAHTLAETDTGATRPTKSAAKPATENAVPNGDITGHRVKQ